MWGEQQQKLLEVKIVVNFSYAQNFLFVIQFYKNYIYFHSSITSSPVLPGTPTEQPLLRWSNNADIQVKRNGKKFLFFRMFPRRK